MKKTKAKKRLAILLVLSFILSIGFSGGNVIAADTDLSFQQELTSKYVDPDRVYSTDVRWWLGEASHTDETLLEEMQALYDAGFRGVELCMQSDSAAPDATYAYGSEMWSHKWKLMMNKFLDLGMGVYLTSGTNWSTSNVPGLDPDSQEAMQNVMLGTGTVNAGTNLTTLPAAGTASTRRGAAKFIGAYAYLQTANNVVDYATMINLTPLVTQGATVWEQNLNWTAPATGTWRVFALWTQGTAQSSSPSAQTSYCTNYFDERGVGTLREFWKEHYLNDPALNKKILNGDVQLFMDSLEISTGAGFTWWAEDMAKEFEARKGYDIRPYLFIISGASASFWNNPYTPTKGTYDLTDNANLREKIINDYQDVLTDLYMERMLTPLKEWLNSVGIKTRAQISYGKPIEISEPIMAVDYPEAENRNQYNQVDVFRLWTGGSKLENKVLSTETGAEDNSSYAYTRQTNLRDAYSQYAAGFQRTIWHIWQAGYGYGNYAWPGYISGLSGLFRFGTREPSSRDYDEFNAHLGRVQQLLQTGKSRTDVGFIHNKWVQGLMYSGGTGNNVTGMNWQLAHMGIFYRSTELQDNGYTYDYFSPEFLFDNDVYFDEETKTIEQAGYKALVIYQSWLDIKGAERILEWAKKGLKIVILGDAAVRTPFNDGKDAELTEIIAEMKKLPTVRTATVNDDIDYFAGVAGGYEDDVYEKLQELGVRPYAEFAEPNHQLLTQSRQDKDGNMYLYAYNYCPNDYHQNSHVESVKTEDHGTNIKTEIKMDGIFIPYAIDAWSGKVTELANYRYENGQTVFAIDLDFNNIALFAFEATDDEKLHIVSTNADSAYTGPDGLGVRATESGTYKTTLSNGKTHWQTVTVPAAYDITDWDVTVESWTDNPTSGDLSRTETIGGVTTTNRKTSTVKTPINVTLDTLKTWNNIPEIGRNVSGLGHYEAIFNWDADKADGAYLNLGDTLVDGMKVWINGKKVGGDVSQNPTKVKKSVGGEVDGKPLEGKDLYSGGISWTKPVADITEYLVDGENKIVIEYSSNLTNVQIARGARTIVNNAGGWWGYHINYRDYGPQQAVIIPYTDIPFTPTTLTLADPSITEYKADAAFDVIVTTGIDASKVKIVNELGATIGKKAEVMTKNGDGTKTYRITLAVGTPGDRTISAMVMGQIGDYEDVGAALGVKIVPPSPLPADDIISATAPAAAGVNTPFTVTVVTDSSVNKIKIAGETGSSIGTLSSSVVTSGNTKVWTISIKVGTKGNRTLTALGAAASGGYGTQGKSFHIFIG